MTMPKAVFLGLALIALAVVWNTESVGQRAATGTGPFMVSASDNAGWRVDTRTGSVSRCRVESFNGIPKCGPWSRPK